MCTGPLAVPGRGQGGQSPLSAARKDWVPMLWRRPRERQTDTGKRWGRSPCPSPGSGLCELCWFSGVPCSPMGALCLPWERAEPSPASSGARGGEAWEPAWTWSRWVQQAVQALVWLPHPSGHELKTKGWGPAPVLLWTHPDPTPGASSRRQLCSHRLGSLENEFQLRNLAPGSFSAASSLL